MPIKRADVVSKNDLQDETPVLMLHPSGNQAEIPAWKVPKMIDKGFKLMEDCPEDWERLKSIVRIPGSTSSNASTLIQERNALKKGKQEAEDLLAATIERNKELEDAAKPKVVSGKEADSFKADKSK